MKDKKGQLQDETFELMEQLEFPLFENMEAEENAEADDREF
jgi:hypothetical protein